jgi:hypothetical protein
MFVELASDDIEHSLKPSLISSRKCKVTASVSGNRYASDDAGSSFFSDADSPWLRCVSWIFPCVNERVVAISLYSDANIIHSYQMTRSRNNTDHTPEAQAWEQTQICCLCKCWLLWPSLPGALNGTKGEGTGANILVEPVLKHDYGYSC